MLDPSEYSEEKALAALHKHNYDVAGTLAAFVLDPQPFLKGLQFTISVHLRAPTHFSNVTHPHTVRWSDEEQAALITAWRLYWKNWKKIQTMVRVKFAFSGAVEAQLTEPFLAQLPGRSTGEIMEFYYKHKLHADHIIHEQRLQGEGFPIEVPRLGA